MKKFDEKLYLTDMYNDSFFPNFMVDKVKALIVDVVRYLESGEHSIDDIQSKFDSMTEGINDLQEEFGEMIVKLKQGQENLSDKRLMIL